MTRAPFPVEISDQVEIVEEQGLPLHLGPPADEGHLSPVQERHRQGEVLERGFGRGGIRSAPRDDSQEREDDDGSDVRHGGTGVGDGVLPESHSISTRGPGPRDEPPERQFSRGSSRTRATEFTPSASVRTPQAYPSPSQRGVNEGGSSTRRGASPSP